MDLDMNALGNKLNAVLDRHSEDLVSGRTSPSLASTSSEALQYHSAVYQIPLTEEEQIRRDEESNRLLTQFWGDESTQRAQEEQSKGEYKALQNLAMRGWGACEKYEKVSSKLAAERIAEDGSRNISMEGDALTWTANDQRAVEFERQKEDYRQLAENLSLFSGGDTESESIEVLRYRLRNLKDLLRLYDSRWRDSFRRLHENTDKLQDRTKIWINDNGFEVQGTCHKSLDLGGSSKAAKAATEKRTRPQRVTLRRSKRIQSPHVPERKVASNVTTKSFAKLQGISKRKSARTTRAKTGKA